MKKTVAITLALLTALMSLLSACGNQNKSDASKDTMAGSYHMVDAAGVGSKELLKIKEGIRLEVRADNTATLSLMNDKHELWFHPDEGICTSPEDAQKVPYTFDGTQIVMDSEPFRMVFER